MRLLICGDRDWTDQQAIEEYLLETRPDVVIEGGARGADRMAGIAAAKLGIPVEVYAADWHGQGRGAGMIRNQRMLNEGKPTHVTAFHDDIAHSKGTADMVRRAIKAGITVLLWSHAGLFR